MFNPDDADVVTFLPRCPEVAARTYAKSVGLPFVPVFYKMRGERSFQGSDSRARKKSIDDNLHLLPGLRPQLAGKTVILIDDSIVRGNNSIRARDILYKQLGVKKAYLVSYTPPIGITPEHDPDNPRGCMFGVDMPPDPPEAEGFIARGRTSEQISDAMGMPVVYISAERMYQAFRRLGLPQDRLCTYCIGGDHPFAGLEIKPVPPSSPNQQQLRLDN